MCTQSYQPEGSKTSSSCVCRNCEYDTVGGIGYMTKKMCKDCGQGTINSRKYGVVRANKYLDTDSERM